MNPLAIAQVVILLFFGFFWLVAFFILYHLARFGVGVFPKRLSVLFLVGAGLLSSMVFFAYFGLIS